MLTGDLALARRLERAEAESFADYARTKARQWPASRAVALPITGGYVVFAGVESPFSRAIGMGMDGPVVADTLDAVEDFYRFVGASSRIDLCPLADRSLIELLGQRGYRLTSFKNVFVRTLAPEPTATPADADRQDLGATPPRIAVAKPEEADRWLLAVARGFCGRDEVTDEEKDIWRPMPHNPRISAYLAWLDDAEPVGAGALEVRDGVALLYSASTRPAFRNRGVQTALLQARLAAATAQDCELALIGSQPGAPSQRNIERAGFRLVYTKLTLERAL